MIFQAAMLRKFVRNEPIMAARIIRKRPCSLGCIFIVITLLAIAMFIAVNKEMRAIKRKVISVSLSRDFALHRSGIEFRSQDAIDGDQPVCMQPHLPVWTEQIRRLYGSCRPPPCVGDEHWVYTRDGRFYISAQTERKVGKIQCAYEAIVNDRDSSKTLGVVFPIKNGSLLRSDAFRVACKSSTGLKYLNIHAAIMPAKTMDKNIVDRKPKYNVLMYGFDSVSRNLMKRFLPQTHKYFTKHLGGHVLTGYNILGDGTPAALMPILTGRKETEIPEVRRGHFGARPVDDVLKFIWKSFENKGYVTQWGEDMAHIGTFQYRMLGFKNQPVHHYMRPFQLQAKKSKYNQKYCLGPKRSHSVFIDWLKEGITTNFGIPFFTFGFFSEYSHENSDCFGLLDEDSVKFFDFIEDIGLLNNTFLILMSDHGARVGQLRQSEQGKLEERSPYFGIYVPQRFRQEFPIKYNNFLANKDRLTTPFDIYETLLDIVGETDKTSRQYNRSFSLFEQIPFGRTCNAADIAPHWCACLSWRNMSTSDTHVTTVSKEAVRYFNALLDEESRVCHMLALSSVIKAVKMDSNNDVLHFKHSSDPDGRTADMSGHTRPDYAYYQVTIETEPGKGLFEITASVNVVSGVVSIGNDNISRINKYGDAPACIASRLPELRPICVCKQLNTSDSRSLP